MMCKSVCEEKTRLNPNFVNDVPTFKIRLYGIKTK